MLVSIVLSLTPVESLSLPMQTGVLVHGWFLAQMQRLDAKLSGALHHPNEVRPFTVSELWCDTLQRRVRRFEAGERYWLRVTSIEPELSRKLLDQWLPTVPLILEIGHAKFALLDKIIDPLQHPWAAVSDYENLAKQAASLPSSKRLGLEFVSPTVFRSNKQLLPFPMPRLVLDGLARQWNRWSAMPFAEELERYIGEKVVVEEYHLRTLPGLLTPAGAVRERGCVGQCVYKMMGHNAPLQETLRCLAAFSFFAGVGKHTAMGLGQTRPLHNDRLR